jgi:hypothetical protein
MTTRHPLHIVDQENIVRIAAPTNQGSRTYICLGVDCASRKISAAGGNLADHKATVADPRRAYAFARP